MPTSKAPWSQRRTIQVLIGLAACLVAAGLTFLVTTRTGGSSDQAAETRGPDRVFRGVATIGGQTSISEQDADRLVEVFHNMNDLVMSRTALATISDLLAKESLRVDPDVRKRLESELIGALRHEQWRVRSTAVVGCKIAGLVDRDTVRSRIVAMQNDPSPQVSTLAQRIIDELDQNGDN